MAYSVECRTTGIIIDEYPTKEEAFEAIKDFEIEDKEYGSYSPDFYDVRDLETDELL